ncbi:hypothetical protein K1T71_010959 [Dendrolimus kikuchii]|uniref:Uncharacterized protein n=1 Tax=Dendrolimus kikuchii TaxID=765133 RepID=A0ACC1CQA6_9NEOP|nr:hypothetical protein K1T71_010959 [Dendrolimus kikuchii]
MCTIPPPPPLLPITTNSLKLSSLTGPQQDLKKTPFNHLALCQWSEKHEELREACIKNSICLYNDPFKYKLRYFESIQQVGPTCGIIALSMLLNGRVSAEKILSIAKDLGYTNNGEMFSCKQLADLAEQVFKLANVNHLTVQVQKGGLLSQETIDRLLDGVVLLVPYDADCNHSPCLKNGHTAHWALICGIIVSKDRDFDIDPNNVHVLAKHGKSKHLAAWKLDDLEKSNKNLVEFSPKRGGDDLVYVLPDGGIGGENGLKNQYLVIGFNA